MVKKKPKKPVPHELGPKNHSSVLRFKESPGFIGFENFFNEKGIYILFVLIFAMVIVIFKDFLLLQKFYLFRDIGSDSININFPGAYHVADYLRTDGIPRWSFKQGLGQNIFPGSFSDPFADLLYVFGKDNVANCIAYAEILKIFCAGLLFFLFLRKISIEAFATVLGAISYAFSGFIILGGAWQGFSTEAVYLAFLLYSFEKLFQDNEWRLFPLAVAAITSFQPFYMYLHGLFLLTYIIFRLAETGALKLKSVVSIGMKMAGLGLIGILMSGFFSIPTIQMMLDSPRGFGGQSSYINKLALAPMFGFADAWQNMTSVLRLFSNDLLGTGAQFKGWNNYLEAPLFYCGLVIFLLLPQIFSFLNKKRKITYTVLLGAYIVPVVFPYFRHAFWLFTGDYYRTFGFFVAIILVVYGIKALSLIIKRGRVNILILGGTLTILLVGLYFPYPFLKDYPKAGVDESLRLIIAGFLIGYACLIALLRFPKIKAAILALILASTCVELAYSAYLTVDTRPVITSELLKQRAWYNDYTVDAVRYLHSIDKSFFRVYKDYSSGNAMHFSINDAKVQDFYGLSSYNSFNQKYYVKFLTELGFIDPADETMTRWLAAHIATERMLHSFVSLKYQITRDPGIPWKGFMYDSLANFGDVYILKNRYCLPLGYTYDSYIPYKEFRQLDKKQKVVALQKALVADSGATALDHFPRIAMADITAPYPWERYMADLAQRRQDTLAISIFRQNYIKGAITVAKNKLLFFSIPYDKGWSARVDGLSITPLLVNIGFMGIPLEKGSHTIELKYMPPYFYLGLFVTITGIAIVFLVMKVKSGLEKKRPEKAAESAV